MAVVQRDLDVPGVTRPMTYEEYLASPEEMARYDILDGWKVYRLYGEQQLTNPTIRHQRIQSRIARAFENYEMALKNGLTVEAPCDVQISRLPLRNRQPDVLFISNERFGSRSLEDPSPLAPAPELVVEIISPSDQTSVLAAKIADYRNVDVQEVWVVRSTEQTIEVMRLALDEIESMGVFEIGQVATSIAFEGLTVTVNDIFTS
jgi:Uma2 family endonuclease